MPPRNTKRKTLIREVLNQEYGGGPVLLEELRWMVFLREYPDGSVGSAEMSVSYQKSFARSVREHLPEATIFKVRRPDLVPCGLLTRAAVYRVRERRVLSSLLDSPFLRGYLSIADGRRKESRREMVGCYLCIREDQSRKRSTSTAIFPTTNPLTLVGARLDVDQLLNVADGTPAIPYWVHPLFGSTTRRATSRPTRDIAQDAKRDLSLKTDRQLQTYLRDRLATLINVTKPDRR